MRREQLLALLEQVAAGGIAPAAALDDMAFDAIETLPFATIDHTRTLRQGYPEVIYSPGKSPEQSVAIAERIAARGDGVLVTRADLPTREALANRFRNARVNELGRTVHVAPEVAPTVNPASKICLIITAGTSDLPVGEEAAETALATGLAVERITDVGVSGIHRILAHRDRLTTAGAIIVVAGMDGALPAVVGGLVAGPVIAVPTSVGYGASFGGVAALLTMLNSCASGITVVNIDNGFGAAIAASRILLT